MKTLTFLAVLRPARWAAPLVAAAALAGCYVVPIQSLPPAAALDAPMPLAPPTPLVFTARLYPANDLAAPYGVVVAAVSNDMNGRGHFSTAIGGEAFGGEATRSPDSTREGQASGAGSRGSYLSCRYTMNSPTLGSGSCRLSNGAAFTMHIGS